LAIATEHVLVGLQMIAEALHPLAADEDQPRLARVLHVAEEVRAQVQHRLRDPGAAAPAELVPARNGGLARLANVVLGLFHAFLLRCVQSGGPARAWPNFRRVGNGFGLLVRGAGRRLGAGRPRAEVEAVAAVAAPLRRHGAVEMTAPAA